MRENYKPVNCNLCGADDYTVLYEARYEEEKDKDLARKFRSSGDEALIDRVVRCTSCGLAYINPVLDGSVIIEGYRKETDETFVSQNHARERTFAKCLDLIENYCPGRAKVLDIGTAGGAFLQVCKQRGWQIAGCEPNQWLCRWAKDNYGIDVAAGTLFEQSYQSASFDLVTLWDVLEHTPDPNAVLRECSRLLKPGGVLVVNYPDIGSWIARIMNRKWVFLLSVHLFYFDKKTMRCLLEKSGFEVIKIKPHFQFLEAAYIFKRAQAYMGGIATIGRNALERLRLDKALIPYWIGQTLVIAKKR